jgi:hypothetical protein
MEPEARVAQMFAGRAIVPNIETTLLTNAISAFNDFEKTILGS